MAKITINSVSLDPMDPPPGLASLVAPQDASGSNYILVQTKAPLTADERKALEAVGARPIEHVPENTYLCHYAPADLTPVISLPFVDWANIYLDGFKIAPALRLRDGRPHAATELSAAGPETTMSQAPLPVEVVLHRDVDPEAARAQLAEAVRAEPGDLRIAGQKVFLLARPQVLDRLARIDAVRHIEEYVAPRLHNSIALGIIGANKSHANAALQGDGQVVAVCDTGFDLGSTTDVHHAFAGRVRRIYPLGRSTGSDPDGHGTHVAGSVLGDGHSATMGGPIKGAAPRASLVLQSVLDAVQGLGGLPDDLNTLFEVPYRDDGARVHTNSWGAPVGGRYTTDSFEVDQFVWDHRDMVVLFSAGNDGKDRNANGVIDNGSIGSPGTARNCITVGASESRRPGISKRYGGPWPNDYPVGPLADDLWADDPNGIAAFSSRGPTRDGRVKPDVVAPGTAILSAHSRAANVGTFWGPSSDTDFCFMGGTSMATPIVAGCAALVREFLQNHALETPSAALVKALLINGATDISGQYTPPDAGLAPNFAEGFGRVNMPATVGPLDAGVSLSWRDEGVALDTGEEWCQRIELEAAADLKATLVWTDLPGETLQNDLDLIVRAAAGGERHGNVAPHSSAFDRVNNVEQVSWSQAPAGAYDVVVRAHRATVHPQPFALVVRVDGSA